MKELNNRYNELYQFRKERKANVFEYKKIRKNSKQFKFFTGVSPSIFNYVFEMVETNVKKHIQKLTKKDQLLIVFMKLRLGLLNADIAYRFNVKPQRVSTIYRDWLAALSKVLVDFIYWPEREAIRKYIPGCFKRFPN